MKRYLESTEYIDWHHPAVASKAADLAATCISDDAIVKNCFEFVRDAIQHSVDFNLNRVTCRASEVLLHRTGYCFAKSHLLAALLRANGIPTGLCYQRLSVHGNGAPYCLHGLNAVYLKQHGWYRLDARGNKPGINAQFSPPQEQLAFSITEKAERDLPEIWPAPLECVIATLALYETVAQVGDNLPDIELIAADSA